MDKNIVLIHGWGGSSEKLTPLGNELGRLGWNVYIPKLPGFEKKSPSRPWSVEDYADYVLEVSRKRFKGNKFYIFGHSFGGRVSMKLAYLYPKYFSGVILCASGGISRGNILKRSIFYVLAKFGKIFLGTKFVSKMWKKLIYKLAREHDYEKTKGVMRDTFKKVVKEDLKKILTKINYPILVLWGENDKVTPFSDASTILKLNKNAILKRYLGLGHKLPYVASDKIAMGIDSWHKKQK